MALHYLLDDGAVLALHGLIDGVRVVLALHRAVGGHADNVQTVDLGKLGGFGAGSTGHTGQLFVHTEVVLEGDGSQRLALAGDSDVLLGLDGLMQTLVVPAADHQTTGELVHDDDLTILDYIVDIPLHYAVGLDSLIDVVGKGHVLGGGKVLHLKIGLGLFDAGGGQGTGLVLFVHNVITIGLLIGGDLIFQLHHHALVQGAHKAVHLRVQAGGVLAAAGDDQGGAGLIDQDGVHLIDDGKGVAALHHVGLVGHHVVAQVVKAELVVGAVGDIGIVGGPAGIAVHALHDQTDGQSQPAVELAHPLAVALGQIVVDGNNVHPLAGQGVQVGGQGSHKGLALTGLHLGNIAAVQGDAAGHLHREVLHAQHTPCGFAADGKGIRQDVVQRFALGQLLLESGSLRLQVNIGHGLILGLQRQHLFGDGVHLFQLPVREAAKKFFNKGHRSHLINLKNRAVMRPESRITIQVYDTPKQQTRQICKTILVRFYMNFL